MEGTIESRAGGMGSTWRKIRTSVSAFLLAVLVVASAPVWGPVYLTVRAVGFLHTRIGQMKRTLLGAAVATIAAFAWMYGAAIQFSAFVAGPMMAVIGCALFYVIVRYGHNEIDTIKELTTCQNQAVAKHYLSYAIIIASVLTAALFGGF